MLTVTRTPLRISLFGGGSDYREHCDHTRGAVVGMAIDKYVYVTGMPLSPIHPYRYRLYWSHIERVQHAVDIQHPVVRVALQHYEVTDPLGLSIIADLPARNGLGSSSAFTVGLVSLLETIKGRRPARSELAAKAIHIERDLLREAGGLQDQWLTAFGGLNHIAFCGDDVQVRQIHMHRPCFDALTSSLVLLHTGITRNAWEVVGEQVQRTKANRCDAQLAHLTALADEAADVLAGTDPDAMLRHLGLMLNAGWETKKELSPAISLPTINTLYAAALAAGAAGGKLCGAGAGGFLLMLVPPENRAQFNERMASVPMIPVRMAATGSTVLAC